MTHDKIISDLIRAYPYMLNKPFEEIAGIVKAYADAVRDITTDNLERGVKLVISESKFFPSIAELRGYSGKAAPIRGKGRQQVTEATDPEREAVYADARSRIKARNWNAPDKVQKRILNAEAALARGIPGQAQYWADYIAYQRGKLVQS